MSEINPNIINSLDSGLDIQKNDKVYESESALDVALQDLSFFRKLEKEGRISYSQLTSYQKIYDNFVESYNNQKNEIKESYDMSREEIMESFSQVSRDYLDDTTGILVETWLWIELLDKHKSWDNLDVVSSRLLRETWMINYSDLQITAYKTAYKKLNINNNPEDNNCLQNISKAFIDSSMIEIWWILDILSVVMEKWDFPFSFSMILDAILEWIVWIFDIDNIMWFLEEIGYNLYDILTVKRAYTFARWIFWIILTATWIWKEIFDVIQWVLHKKSLWDLVNINNLKYSSNNNALVLPKNTSKSWVVEPFYDKWSASSLPDKNGIAKSVESWEYWTKDAPELIINNEKWTNTIEKVKSWDFNILSIWEKNEVLDQIKNNFPWLWVLSMWLNSWDRINSAFISSIKSLNDTIWQEKVDEILSRFSQKMSWMVDDSMIASRYNNFSFSWPEVSWEEIQQIMNDAIISAWFSLDKVSLPIWTFSSFVESWESSDIIYSLLKAQTESNFNALPNIRKTFDGFDVNDLSQLWDFISSSVEKIASASQKLIHWWKVYEVSDWNLKISYTETSIVNWRAVDFLREKNIIMLDDSWELTHDFIRAVRKWQIPEELSVYSDARQIFDVSEKVAWGLPPLAEFTDDAFKELSQKAETYASIKDKVNNWESLSPQELDFVQNAYLYNYKWVESPSSFFSLDVWENSWRWIFIDVMDLWVYNILGQKEKAQELSRKVKEYLDSLNSWDISPEKYDELVLSAQKESMFNWNQLMTDKMIQFSNQITQTIRDKFPDLEWFRLTMWWDEFFIYYDNLPDWVNMQYVDEQIKKTVNDKLSSVGIKWRTSSWDIVKWENIKSSFWILDRVCLPVKKIEERLQDAICSISDLSTKSELMKIKANIISDRRLIDGEYVQLIKIKWINDSYVRLDSIVEEFTDEAWEIWYRLSSNSSLTQYLDDMWVWKVWAWKIWAWKMW